MATGKSSDKRKGPAAEGRAKSEGSGQGVREPGAR